MSEQQVACFECEAILFDLDGVLVDSTRCIEATWTAWAYRVALDPSPVLRAAHGRTAIETVRLMAPQLDAAREAAELAAYEARAVEGVLELSGARTLLEQLPPHRWAIVTSAVRAVATHRLQLARLPIPRVMICADDVEHGKPNAEGYLAAAATLAYAPADCLVIEDAPAGIAAAKAAAMRAIGITATHSGRGMLDATIIVPDLAALIVELQHRDSDTRIHIRIRRALQR